MKAKSTFIVAITLFIGVVILAACQTAPATTPSPMEPTPCPTAAPCPACPDCPPPPKPVVEVVPFQEDWVGSPHNDVEAEAFKHWNEVEPKEIPIGCATCHSTAGYLDFLGDDSSLAGVVDKAVPAPGGTIQCLACHNHTAATLDKVVFPYIDSSGKAMQVAGLRSSMPCLVCHQGRTSKAQVDRAIADAGLKDAVDKVSDPTKPLNFVDIHFSIAGATLYGTQAKSGYEYEGKSYDIRYAHVAGYDTCSDCHNPHNLSINLEKCSACHQGVVNFEDLKKIRMAGSLVDYDGDGDVIEGIAAEIEGLQNLLLTAIQRYAQEKAGAAIGYDPVTQPYFFTDKDGDGQIAADEALPENAYQSWTARLLKAAYNYQFSRRDAGGYAHNGKYSIALLYDSVVDLNTALSNPVDLSKAHRRDAGHFAGSENAFRFWDEAGQVPGDCAKCHSASGLPVFLSEAAAQADGVSGRNVAVAISNGFACSTCHSDLATFSLTKIDKVKFPSGNLVTFGEGVTSNLCLQCHQGRASKFSVDEVIQASVAQDDEISDKLSFIDPHDYPAGAMLFGTEAQGGYEYRQQAYLGRNLHSPGFNTCVACHDKHALQVKVAACSGCHMMVKSAADVTKIRMSTEDYDGDGDALEGIAGEVRTMLEKLFEAIQKYAMEKAGMAILYDPNRYPYFFSDTNSNGQIDADEQAYASWTPRLLRAAYNYRWVQSDPGAFAHHGKYVLQLLYDAFKDLGGNLTGMKRP